MATREAWLQFLGGLDAYGSPEAAKQILKSYFEEDCRVELDGQPHTVEAFRFWITQGDHTIDSMPYFCYKDFKSACLIFSSANYMDEEAPAGQETQRTKRQCIIHTHFSPTTGRITSIARQKRILNPLETFWQPPPPDRSQPSGPRLFSYDEKTWREFMDGLYTGDDDGGKAYFKKWFTPDFVFRIDGFVVEHETVHGIKRHLMNRYIYKVTKLDFFCANDEQVAARYTLDYQSITESGDAEWRQKEVFGFATLASNGLVRSYDLLRLQLSDPTLDNEFL